jgi:hypothetical protein
MHLTEQDILKRVRQIEIKTRGLSDEIFAGKYHSAFRGRGMSFAEVREYRVGDDVRDIDWNVTARSERTHVKVFEEERELTMMLVVDVSPSRMFGSKELTKKNVITVPTVGTTIPHRQLGVFGAGKVLLMPAAPGTGVIAGSSVRTVLEAAGVKDIRAKSIGSNNTGNMAYATMEGLKSLMTVEEVARRRGKTKEEILG